MRKKTFRYILFACLACLLVAGFVLRQQFYGNAVRAVQVEVVPLVVMQLEFER